VNFLLAKPHLDDKMFGGTAVAIKQWRDIFLSVVVEFIQQEQAINHWKSCF
jgi:hypothetical protein